MKFLEMVFSATVLCIVPTISAFGQNGTGSIEGIIVDDATQSPLIGAHVLVVGSPSGGSSDSQGRFIIANLPAATYALRISSMGYTLRTVTDVVVRPGRTTQVSVGLKEAALEGAEVMVTARYFDGRFDRQISELSFSNEEIRRAPGAAGDVSRIMMSLPSVAKVNDQSNGLIVRGGSPAENGFFVDGIAIPNINHFPTQGATSGPIGMINVDFLRDVTFSSGGFSAAFGDRLSSIMQMEWREGDREKFQGQLDLNFAGFGGAAEGPVPFGKGSWLVSVRRSYLDLLIKAIDMGTSLAPRYGDEQWKIVFDINPNNRIELLGLWGDDHNNPDAETGEKNDMAFFGNQDHQESTNGAVWNALWGDRGYSRTSVSFTSAWFSEDLLETGSGAFVEKNRSLEQEWRIRNETHLKAGQAQMIEFGFDARRRKARFDNLFGTYTDAFGNAVAGFPLQISPSAASYGMFMSIRSTISDRLSATIGVRGDYTTLNDRVQFSPRLSATCSLDDRTSMTATMGIYHQELPLVLLAQHPENRALHGPSAVHYIVGVERLLTESLKLSFEAYEKDYWDFPVDPAERTLFLIDELYFRSGFFFDHGTLDETGKARSRGIEVVVQQKLAEVLYGLLSASYSSCQYRPLSGEWIDRVYDNRVIFSVEGGYKATEDWEFSARWVYAGGTPYTPFDIAASQQLRRGIFDESRIDAARYPAYHSLNVRVDKRFNFSGSSLVCYLSVWNAYNRKNVAQYIWDESENQQKAVYQWGVLPVFGLEYEL